MENSKENEKNGGFEAFEVGDIVTIDDKVQERFVITCCMPIKNPSYFQTLSKNGKISTVWIKSIKKRVGHVDIKGLIFDKLELEGVNDEDS